jgi:hypothetical protein
MKARQCAKIAELRRVLLAAGYYTLNRQAIALGLSRSTTWAILQANHKSSGLSGSLIKRMLRSRELPPAARQWIEEYVAEKLTGAYGHKRNRLDIFRAQVDLRAFAPPESFRRAPAKPSSEKRVHRAGPEFHLAFRNSAGRGSSPPAETQMPSQQEMPPAEQRLPAENPTH